MTKIGNRLGSVVFIFLSLLLTSTLNAQDVTVEATLSETNIFAGEGVTLQIAISGTSVGTLDRPTLPEIPGLRWLPNRTSQSSNYTYLNNRPSVTISYGFQLIAEDVGSHKIPPIGITIEGKTYVTKPISFKVLDPKTIDTGKAERSPDIYVRLETNVTKPVVGQQVVATIVLYFKTGIEVNSYQASPGWKAEGFWKEELEMQRQARSNSTLINGVRYQRAQLLNYALFPTKTGTLTLSPFTITVRMRQSRNGVRDPFSLSFGQENKELKTLPITLEVQNLPNAGDVEVIGAVGNFKINRKISTTKAMVGESIEVETTISGTGNVPLLNKPNYEFPEALEKYNPQESSKIERGNNQISGSKTFTDIVIARNEGTFEIPEKKIAIYNPIRKAFDYTTLPSLNFSATPDPKAFNSNLTETRLDIKPSIGLAQWKTLDNEFLIDRTTLWSWLLLPFVVLLSAFGFKKYRDRMDTDSGFARSQKAKQKALSTLQDASATTDIKHGYHLIQQALSLYIADRLNLPEAGLSANRLIQEVQTTSPEMHIDDLRNLFEKCETIAYAPNVSQDSLTNDIELSKELIKKMGKYL
tara:strand:- start:930 stop:2681 length:1752 start_codon:yes stop_codon:yes gene_type:complete